MGQICLLPVFAQSLKLRMVLTFFKELFSKKKDPEEIEYAAEVAYGPAKSKIFPMGPFIGKACCRQMMAWRNWGQDRNAPSIPLLAASRKMVFQDAGGSSGPEVPNTEQCAPRCLC